MVNSLPAQAPTLREIAAVATLVAIVTAGMMWPLLGGLSTHFPVSAGDAAFNSWVLAWDADRIAHGLFGVWSPPIFYPYSNALAYSENLLGIAVVAAPVQWLTGDPILTFNVAWLLSFVVAGVGAYVLALEVTRNRTAALVAALGFAFTPYRWAQLTHLQVLWTAWLPLVLWALHRALRTSRPSHWAVFVIAVLLQVFSNGYSAFQAALAIVFVAGAWMLKYGIDRGAFLRLLGAALAIGLMLLPAVQAHLQVWGAQDPTPGDLVTYSADVSTYLNVHPDLPASNWLPGLAQDEGHLFPGTAILLLALLAMLPMGRSRPVTRWRWMYAGLAFAALALSLGPEPRAWGHELPFPPIYRWLVSAVPLFEALRVPARFGLLAILAINVLAACGVARVAPVLAGVKVLVPVVAACVLILWEGYGGPVTLVRYAVAPDDGEAAATRWLASQPPGPLLNLPMSTLGETSDMRQQYAVLEHRHPTINGVSRLGTPLMEWLSGSSSPLVVPELLPEAVPFLRGLGVRFILMRPNEFHDPGIAARLSDTLTRDATVRERGRFGDIIAWEIEAAPERRAEEPLLRPLASSSLALTASENPDRVLFAVDGDHGTRWLTQRPQNGSEWMAIDFDRPRNLARIDFIIHARSLINFPRSIEVVASGRVAGSLGTTLFRGSVLGEMGRGWRLFPDEPTASITLPSHIATRVVIHQRGQASSWFWAIDDLVLWERD